jgi:hypothetical protein
MYWASAGSAIGPPWQSTRISRLTRLAASCIACTRPADSSRVTAVGADRAFGRQPHVRDQDVGAGLGHRRGFVGIEAVGRGQEAHLVGRADHVDFQPEAHPGFFQVLPKLPSIRPTVGKFCTPEKAGRVDVAEEQLHHAEWDRCRRRRPARACSTTGITSRAISMTIALASP